MAAPEFLPPFAVLSQHDAHGAPTVRPPPSPRQAAMLPALILISFPCHSVAAKNSPTQPPTNLPRRLCTHSCTHPPTHPPLRVSIYPPTQPPTHPRMYASMHAFTIYPPIFPRDRRTSWRSRRHACSGRAPSGARTRTRWRTSSSRSSGPRPCSASTTWCVRAQMCDHSRVPATRQ